MTFLIELIAENPCGYGEHGDDECGDVAIHGQHLDLDRAGAAWRSMAASK
jgi:hypothetical protein